MVHELYLTLMNFLSEDLGNLDLEMVLGGQVVLQPAALLCDLVCPLCLQTYGNVGITLDLSSSIPLSITPVS